MYIKHRLFKCIFFLIDDIILVKKYKKTEFYITFVNTEMGNVFKNNKYLKRIKFSVFINYFIFNFYFYFYFNFNFNFIFIFIFIFIYIFGGICLFWGGGELISDQSTVLALFRGISSISFMNPHSECATPGDLQLDFITERHTFFWTGLAQPIVNLQFISRDATLRRGRKDFFLSWGSNRRPPFYNTTA